MPDPDRIKLIMNGMAKAFHDPEPSAEAASGSTSPSGNGDADQARANFHNDLKGSICPDCHAAVKQVMGDSPSSAPSSGPVVDPENGPKVANSLKNAFGN